MSKVKKITVSNLKAISDLEMDFDGCTAIITGGNNKGKSSFLKSLPDRLRQVKPDVILKEGTKEGFAEWTLTTGERFIWEFNDKAKSSEKLTFISRDDIKSSITREIANKFFPKTFDIDKFLTSGPKLQKETLQRVVGLDFSDVEARYKKAYEDRTFENRNYAQVRAKEIKKHIGLPKKQGDILPLQEKLSSIVAHNEKHEYVTRGIVDKDTQAIELAKDIKRLKEEIEAKEESLNKLAEESKKGNEWLKKNRPISAEDKAKIEKELATMIEDNKKIAHNEEADKIEKEIKLARKKAEDADKLVQSIEKEKVELIKNANLPEGFGFSEDGVTYKGHALTKEQLSSSAIYIASLKLAEMALGQVRTLHFDASTLDRKSLGEIEKWAKENDLQLFIERPDFDGGEIEYHIVEE